MTDPEQYMALKCPHGSESRYACKVAGTCHCGVDDDLYAAFEKRCVWKAKRPVVWPRPADWEAL